MGNKRNLTIFIETVENTNNTRQYLYLLYGGNISKVIIKNVMIKLNFLFNFNLTDIETHCLEYHEAE